MQCALTVVTVISKYLVTNILEYVNFGSIEYIFMKLLKPNINNSTKKMGR